MKLYKQNSSVLIKVGSSRVLARFSPIQTLTIIQDVTAVRSGVPQTTEVAFEFTSAQQPRSGQFLDGSYWIEAVDDLALVSVSPGQSSFAGTGSFAGKTFDINRTLVNPDFGKVTYDLQSNTWSLNRTSDGTSVSARVGGGADIIPLDGRVGADNDNGSTAFVDGIYDDQSWDESETLLSQGDQIIKVISNVDGGTETPTNGIGFSTLNGESFIDGYAIVSVVSSADVDAGIEDKYRPPIVWDVSDKANRPIFSHTDFTTQFAGVPSTDYYGNSYSPDDGGAGTLKYKTSDFDKYNGSCVIYGVGYAPTQGYGPDPSYLTSRNCVAANVSPKGYGSQETHILDRMCPAMFDGDVAAATRKAIQVTYTQRGIDVYGSMRSGGRTIYPTGGWGRHLFPYLEIAYATTGSSDMYDLMNSYTVGSNASTLGPADIIGGNARFFDDRIRDLTNTGSFTHLRRKNVPIRSTGTETIDGQSYRWIVLDHVPDMGDITEAQFTVDNKSQFHSYYNPSTGSNKTSGNQLATPFDNTGYLVVDDALCGLAVKGSAGIARVFKSVIVDSSGTVSGTKAKAADGYYYKLWLTSDVTAGTDATVDTAPYTTQDLSAGRKFIEHTGDSFEVDYLMYYRGPYGYNGLAHCFLEGAIKSELDTRSLDVPAEIQKRYDTHHMTMSWSVTSGSYEDNGGSTYVVQDEWHRALWPDVYGINSAASKAGQDTQSEIALWEDGLTTATDTIPSDVVWSFSDLSWFSTTGGIQLGNQVAPGLYYDDLLPKPTPTTRTLNRLMTVGTSGSTTFDYGGNFILVHARADFSTTLDAVIGTTGSERNLYIWPTGSATPVVCTFVSRSGERAWYSIPSSGTLNNVILGSWGLWSNMQIFFGSHTP